MIETIEELDGLQLRINNLTYTIRTVPHLRQPNGMSLLAQVDNARLTIDVSTNLIRPLMLPVLLHEIYHIYCEQTGRDNSEEEANAIGYFFAQLITNNQWLFDASYQEQ